MTLFLPAGVAQIGEVTFVTGVAVFLAAPLAGKLSRAVNPRIDLSVGFTLAAAGL